MTAPVWHTTGIEEVRAALDLPDAGTGLTSADAAARREHYGPNKLEESTADPWYVVLGRQIASPMVIFLLLAGIVTLIQQEWFEGAVIFLVVVLNSSIGYWQARKAEKDVAALAELSTPEATVVRDGAVTGIPATDLVPGDTVRLESGDMVPADLRITASIGLRVDESMLTGEVLPTAKRSGVSDHGVELAEDAALGDRVTMAYSGTLVVSGRATGLVVTTGRDTELGSIADLVQTDSGKTPLQVLTDRLEKTIAVLLVVVGVAVFITNLILGTGLGDAFRSTVALIVSSMPEALPVVLSVAMGVGVSRMATRNAVVRHLPSVETLGSTTVIGSDKTGTLTVNRMTVETVWTPTGLDETPSLRTGALTNDATVHPDGDTLIGDAVDVAMATAALDRGVVTGEERSTAPVADMPYEPEYAYSQTLRRETGEDGTDRLVLHVKGAPEVVASFCRGMGGGSVRHEAMVEANHAMAADGLRVIATASRVLDEGEAVPKSLDTPHDLQFTGLQGMMDPPREGVREAIGQCRSAGIHVMMITGDHPVTAVAIGRRLGPGTSRRRADHRPRHGRAGRRPAA